MELTNNLITYVCNPGLASIGARILTGTSDASNEAVLCKTLYEPVRDAELRERIWGCTKKRTALTADGTAPNHDWDYRYAVPSNCLYLIGLENDADYTIESGYILTNEKNSSNQINILYVQKADVSDSAAVDAELSRFDSTLRNVLAKRLVAEASKSITKKRSEQEQAWGLYDKALEAAALANAYENRHERENRLEPKSKWITSRLG